MDQYPCIICSTDCKNDALQCTNCRQWVHSDCILMSANDLRSWSRDYLEFLCTTCSFNGDVYDAGQALQRLQRAFHMKEKNALTNAARSESKLLITYGILIPESEHVSTNGEKDAVSVDILKMYNPAILRELVPMSVCGDGNCLYRAVSRALIGSENFHELLRLRTAIELILNPIYYDEKCSSFVDLICDNRIVVSDYSKLVEDAIVAGSYSEMAHIYALSASISKPIRSYYPPQLQAEFASQPFNRKVVGRSVNRSASPAACIMWTRISVPERTNGFIPNHFVPLVYENKEHMVIINVDDSLDDSVDVNSVNSDMTAKHFSNESHTDIIDDVNEIHNEVKDGNDTYKHPAKGKLDQCQFLDTGKVVELLLKSNSIVECIPCGLKENVYFIVNNTRNLEKRATNGKSSFSDDCGVWDTSAGASPKSYYLLSDNANLTMIFKKNGIYCLKRQVQRKTEYLPFDPQPGKDQVVVIHRYYTQLKKDHMYKKRVTWLGEGGLTSNLSLVEYVGKFPGLTPHGNSRQTTEYLRTPDIVFDEITEMTGKMKPHQILNKLTSKYDELSQPSGLQQIYDKQKYENSKDRKTPGHCNNIADQIRCLENLVTENNPFVRSVIRTNAKPPCVILYTDEQITDIKNLCCSGQTVLGIDKTFMLCKMHVTVTCYKQLAVKRVRTGEPPIFLGPLFIHDNSDFETYSHFFHHLKVKRIDSNLKSLVIGSDDEKALVKGITLVLPEATHVLCTRHLQENVRHILTDDAVTVTDRNIILKQIFGKDGLVDANDSICFDDKCEVLENHCADISQKFLNYFRKKLKTNIKFKVNKPLRIYQIDRMWKNNNCESMNHVLKQTVEWKTKTLTEFVQLTHQLVTGQFRSLRSALVCTGEFRLADSHKQFETRKTDWIKMTDQQRTNLFIRFRRHIDMDTKYMISTDGQTTVVAPRTNGRKPGQRKRKINVRIVTITAKNAKHAP